MDPSSQIRYLSAKTLGKLAISSREVIESLEALILAEIDQSAWSAAKSVIEPPDGRYIMTTLAGADDPQLVAIKAVVLNPDNPEQGLPQINGIITLLDSVTGIPVAIVDGNWVTAIRTAAASAMVAKRLARADSSIIAFIGCGVQAQSHLTAFQDLFPLTEIRAYARGSKNRDALCRKAQAMGLIGTACTSAKQAVDRADIIITSVTISNQIDPFLDGNWLAKGAFVASTDLAIPWMKTGMDAFDQIIIDDCDQEQKLERKMVESRLISGDLKALIQGTISGRVNDDQRIAFVFRAVPLGDLALSALAYRKAEQASLGTMIDR
jgi:ornithine cyclodeaminase/alanine dehydrogenase-like protein (mu-crystallin family)